MLLFSNQTNIVSFIISLRIIDSTFTYPSSGYKSGRLKKSTSSSYQNVMLNACLLNNCFMPLWSVSKSVALRYC